METGLYKVYVRRTVKRIAIMRINADSRTDAMKHFLFKEGWYSKPPLVVESHVLSIDQIEPVCEFQSPEPHSVNYADPNIQLHHNESIFQSKVTEVVKCAEVWQIVAHSRHQAIWKARQEMGIRLGTITYQRVIKSVEEIEPLPEPRALPTIEV